MEHNNSPLLNLFKTYVLESSAANTDPALVRVRAEVHRITKLDNLSDDPFASQLLRMLGGCEGVEDFPSLVEASVMVCDPDIPLELWLAERIHQQPCVGTVIALMALADADYLSRVLFAIPAIVDDVPPHQLDYCILQWHDIISSVHPTIWMNDPGMFTVALEALAAAEYLTKEALASTVCWQMNRAILGRRHAAWDIIGVFYKATPLNLRPIVFAQLIFAQNGMGLPFLQSKDIFNEVRRKVDSMREFEAEDFEAAAQFALAHTGDWQIDYPTMMAIRDLEGHFDFFKKHIRHDLLAAAWSMKVNSMTLQFHSWEVDEFTQLDDKQQTLNLGLDLIVDHKHAAAAPVFEALVQVVIANKAHWPDKRIDLWTIGKAVITHPDLFSAAFVNQMAAYYK